MKGSHHSGDYYSPRAVNLIGATAMFVFAGKILTATEINSRRREEESDWINKVRPVTLSVRTSLLGQKPLVGITLSHHFVVQTRKPRLRELNKVTHPTSSQWLTVSSLHSIPNSRSRASKLHYNLSSLNMIIILMWWEKDMHLHWSGLLMVTQQKEPGLWSLRSNYTSALL